MCVVCGYPKVHAQERCHVCYRYRRCTGKDRTEELIIRPEQLAMEREDERRLRRAFGWPG